jgi:hypothetical protein
MAMALRARCLTANAIPNPLDVIASMFRSLFSEKSERMSTRRQPQIQSI